MPLAGENDSAPIPRIPVIVVLGPTGVGKTALAVRLARHFGGEIVGADSRQIYRQMEAATAKPSAAERAAVPHHLIDIADPDQTLTLAGYQAAAYAAIHDIHARGKLPLLVGGTGQYLTAVLEGWSAPEVPPNPALRERLEAEAAQHGPGPLFERLIQRDPDAAGFIDPHNLRRIIRALEVCIETGRPFSTQRTKSPPPFGTLKLGLTMPREMLYTRLDSRIDDMLAAGLLEEVRGLHARGYGWRLPSMSGLGYAQLGAFVRGECTLAEAVTAFRHATHTFVRRQYTWFRRDADIQWLDAPPDDAAWDALIARVTAWRANQANRANFHRGGG